MSDRCTGDCCALFYIPYSVEEIQEGAVTGRWGEDSAMLADMLIPKDYVPERRDIELARWSGYTMTCKHFDGTGCTVYESRPGMCRRYPNDGRCFYKGCTFDEVKGQLVKLRIPMSVRYPATEKANAEAV